MTWLTTLLTIKIIGTLLLVVIPFLVLPRARLDGMLRISSESATLYRLYGVAVAALLVGYGGAIWQAMADTFPTEILLMGLVSNAGATIVLRTVGSSKRQALPIAFFGAIAICIAVALLAPDASMTKVFE